MKSQHAVLESPPVRTSCWERMRQVMSRPVSGASLALLRIGVGLVMCLEAYSLWRPHHGSISSGKSQLETYFTGPDITFNFPYSALSWLPLLPKAWIYAIVWLIAVTGAMVALGIFYRAAIVTLLLAWAYLFAVESTRTYWQSYYYLEMLVLFLLAWMPAARMFSLDALRTRRQGATEPVTVPSWCLFLLRGQLVIAYFYGGVAKLNKDWLLDAAPMRWFLRVPGVLGPYERFLPAHWMGFLRAVVESSRFAYFLRYTGVAFDLTVGFLLLFRRTRIFGLILMLVFHATNHFLIFSDIEWFPLVGAWTALFFLDPDWPLRFWTWVRRPFVKKPDWKWFWPGLVLCPFAGAALGWKLKPTPEAAGANKTAAVKTTTIVFVLIWLGLQIVIPLRRFAVPADARFTHEGLSFSWRLKSEASRGLIPAIFVEDSAILGKDAAGRPQINWKEWHGERAIYRSIAPQRIDWLRLPEIVVVMEPIIGERIIFNPCPRHIQSLAQAQERVGQIWLELQGRAPENVLPALPFPRVLDLLSHSLNAAGELEESGRVARLAEQTDLLERRQLAPQDARTALREVGKMLNRLQQKDAGALRRTMPFAIEGAPHPDAPFLLIEDARSFDNAPIKHVDRKLWRNGAETRGMAEPAVQDPEAEPMIIYTGTIGLNAKTMLPLAYFFERQDGTPRIQWNNMKDVDESKLIHLSIQPFYLKRYACRVANLWQEQYGRRPQVNAVTSVSINGRPYQELVDPDADLAAVSVKWFRHNEWIRDLQTTRIPPAALTSDTVLAK